MASRYDALVAAWRMPCPLRDEPQVIPLASFRRIQHLGGTHAAYSVRFRCTCGQHHPALMSGDVLDLAPVTEPLPVHHDLLLGHEEWAPDLMSLRFSEMLAAGRWPLPLTCTHCRRAQIGYPSCLRTLEPDVDAAPTTLMVAFACPQCEQPGVQQMRAERLSFQWMV